LTTMVSLCATRENTDPRSVVLVRVLVSPVHE